MEQDVSEMVNKARGEGVDRMMRLKKRYGCTKDNHELAVTQLKVGNVWFYVQNESSDLMFHLLC